MKKTNVLLLLTPKASVACLQDTMNIRQAYEKMKAHRFMAIPLINDNGEYIGTITEGDILHFLVASNMKLEDLTGVNIMAILRKDYTPAVKVDADLSTILDLIAKGEIRCGTGVPLDVNWNDNDNGVPWSTDSPVKAGNPWSQY